MPDNSRPGQGGRWKRWLAATTGIAVVAAGVVAYVFAQGDEASSVPTFTLERQPLLISVTESGTIQAHEQIVIKSELEGRATILQLVDEGTRVQAGDLLVELDASGLQDQVVDQEIRVQNANASFVQARENLAVVKNQAESDVTQAELDLSFAKQDLEKYLSGEYPNQVDAAKSTIVLAEAELKQATEKLEWSTVLNQEKYLSKTELEADELAKRRAELDLKLARQDLELLQQYTHKRQVAELRSAVRQAELALERVQRKARADVVQAEANLKAKQAEQGQQQRKLQKLRDQIEKATITAPRAGMVVFATSTRASWRGNADPLEEGQEVRERQELIYLPTAEEMKAQVSIHEADLDKLRTDLPVRIRVDALPGRMFRGRVIRIAPLPDAASMFMNPDLKIYDTDVIIEGETRGLRTGMSCEATILVAKYDDALAVPIQAVVRRGPSPTVYVQTRTGFEPRPVQIGLDNARLVHITDGLQPGDVVSLAPPLADAASEPIQGPDPDAVGDIPAPAEKPSSRSNAQPGTDAQAKPQAESEAAAPNRQNSKRPSAESPDTERAGDERQNPADRGGRRDWSNMSEEQKEKARERFRNMSPEQRRKLREQGQERRQQGDS